MSINTLFLCKNSSSEITSITKKYLVKLYKGKRNIIIDNLNQQVNIIEDKAIS